jgi:NAD(P)-dependent dehydrogenase (short-subunit alcohol dehydrogenase family)
MPGSSVGNTDVPVAIVTGAASGMGHAVATRFLDAGWTVLGLDLRKPQLEGTRPPAVPGQRGSAASISRCRLASSISVRVAGEGRVFRRLTNAKAS